MPSGWAEQSKAYADLHRITFSRCNDLRDYIGRLKTAHYRLSTTGLEVPEVQLTYILLAGLGVEFDSWISNVRKQSKMPSYDTLADDLVASFPYKGKPPSKQKVFLKPSCNNCGLDHPSDNCHKLFS